MPLVYVPRAGSPPPTIFGFGDAFIPVQGLSMKFTVPASLALNPTTGDMLIEPARRDAEIFGPAPGPIGKSARKDAIQMDNGLFYNNYRLPDFPVIRDNITVATAANNDPFVLYAGGNNAAGSRVSSGYILNTLTNTYSVSFSMGQSFDHSSGRAVPFVRSGVNGMLLIPGFQFYSTSPSLARQVRFIDPQGPTSASSVAQLPPHPNDPTETAGVKWDGPNLVYCEQGTYTGSVFMFGGGGAAGGLSTHRRVFRLDPNAVSWVDLGNMTSFGGAPFTRNACAFQSDDGRLFLTGGVGNGGGQLTKFLYEYDQDANTWSELTGSAVSTNPVNSAGSCKRTTVEGSGRLMVMGPRANGIAVSIPDGGDQHFDGFEQYADGDIDTVAPSSYFTAYRGAGSTSLKAVTTQLFTGGQKDNYFNGKNLKIQSSGALLSTYRFVMSEVAVPEDTWTTCVFGAAIQNGTPSSGIGFGVVFRWTDINNYMVAWINRNTTDTTWTLVLSQRKAGVDIINLARTTITRDDMDTNDGTGPGRRYLFQVRMIGTRIYARFLHPGFNGGSASNQSGTQHKGVFAECASIIYDTTMDLTGGNYKMGVFMRGFGSTQEIEYMHADYSVEGLNEQIGTSTLEWGAMTSGFTTGNVPPRLSNLSLSESTASQYDKAIATFGASTGKKYWEVYIAYNGTISIGRETDLIIGMTTDSGVAENVDWTLSTHRSVRLDGTLWSDAANLGTFDPAAQEQYLTGLSDTNRINIGDVLMFAADLDTGDLWIGRNGNWHDGALPSGIRSALATTTHTFGAGTWRPWVATSNVAATNLNRIWAQFSPEEWFYQVPDGYSSW